MASTTPSTPFKPLEPKIGGLIQVSHREWCAWTGGQPKADWSELNGSAPSKPNEDFQLRPSSPGSSQKSTAQREVGLLVAKHKRDAHLLDFAEIVETYLQRNGLDSITYLPNPQDPSKMISIIQHYSKFELQSTIEAAWILRKSKYDRYDCNNDDSARNWLLNSLDAELKDDVTKRVKSTDGFCVNWLQMIRLV
jgi:hypothetical protein